VAQSARAAMPEPPTLSLSGVTRRSFIQASAGSLLLVVGGGWLSLGCSGQAPTWRMILSDPALCGACRRCAITCSSLRAGGPGAARGLCDPDRIYQAVSLVNDHWYAATCRMCPELRRGTKLLAPTCVSMCPPGAAQIAQPGHPLYGDSGVRFIDPSKCVGCGACVSTCPYSHPLLFDGKATKCDLCLGRSESPPCVDACPASALHYLDYWTETVPRPFPWDLGGASGDSTAGGSVEG
jgi:Fe-S-cluster-containing hydrogenase component 2